MQRRVDYTDENKQYVIDTSQIKLKIENHAVCKGSKFKAQNSKSGLILEEKTFDTEKTVELLTIFAVKLEV